MHDEQQRIHDQKRRVRNHPRGEEHHEPTQLVSDVTGECTAEHGGHNTSADERDEPGGGADESERDPCRVHHVIRSAGSVDTAAGQGRRRDQRE